MLAYRLAKEVAAEVEEAAANAEKAVKRQKTEGALAHMQSVMGQAAAGVDLHFLHSVKMPHYRGKGGSSAHA